MTTRAQAIDQRLQQQADSMWAVGTVTAITGTVLTVSMNGASLQLHKLASYSPMVGDVVQIACPPGRPFVLGKIG